jgi:flagellar hook assembly protein FlgD
VTTIDFTVGARAPVSLKVYTVQGRLVQTLVQGRWEPGSYRARWDGRDSSGRQMPSGVYFYQLQVGDVMTSRKMLLLR